MAEAPVHVISLGAGVQSTTLALMAARGQPDLFGEECEGMCGL